MLVNCLCPETVWIMVWAIKAQQNKLSSVFILYVLILPGCLCLSQVMRKLRPSQGFWGTGEQGHLFQGNRGTKAKFLGNKDNIGEQGTLKIKFSIFGEQGNKPIYFRGSGEQGNRHPPPPPPPAWEGLKTAFCLKLWSNLFMFCKVYLQNVIVNQRLGLPSGQ